MTLTFPRDMPCPVTGDVSFRLVYMDARALPGGGSPQVVNLGPALWRGRWAVTARRGGEIEEWCAWASSLRGGLRLFKGRPKRRWPMAHPRGFGGMQVAGSPWSGAGALAAIGALRDTVTVTGLPSNLAVRPGDFLSVPVGARQHLHEVTEGGTASAGTLVVSIEPALHVLAATGAPVTFDGPWCDMALVAAPERSMALATGSVSFEALQVLI